MLDNIIYHILNWYKSWWCLCRDMPLIHYMYSQRPANKIASQLLIYEIRLLMMAARVDTLCLALIAILWYSQIYARPLPTSNWLPQPLLITDRCRLLNVRFPGPHFRYINACSLSIVLRHRITMPLYVLWCWIIKYFKIILKITSAWLYIWSAAHLRDDKRCHDIKS